MNPLRALLLLGVVALVLHLWRRRIVDTAVIALFGGLSVLAVRNVAKYSKPAIRKPDEHVDEWEKGVEARTD